MLCGGYVSKIGDCAGHDRIAFVDEVSFQFMMLIDQPKFTGGFCATDPNDTPMFVGGVGVFGYNINDVTSLQIGAVTRDEIDVR